MSKSKLTKEIEFYLKEQTMFPQLQTSIPTTFGVNEVNVSNDYKFNYVDYITCDRKDVIRCYEIKISISDFHSKCKLGFVGDFNYFVLTNELYSKVKSEIDSHIGVFIYDKKYHKFKSVKKAKNQNISMNDKLELKNKMMRKSTIDLFRLERK